MDNIQQNIPRANLKKKNIARLVLYSELSKYYTMEEIDQMLATISEGGFVDLRSYLKKSEVETELSPTSVFPVSSECLYSVIQGLIARIEELERKVEYYHPEGVTITVSPQTVYVGQRKQISITASLTIPANRITLYRGNDAIYQIEDSTSLEYQDIVAPATTDSIVYRVVAVIGSETKTNEAIVSVEEDTVESITWTGYSVNPSTVQVEMPATFVKGTVMAVYKSGRQEDVTSSAVFNAHRGSIVANTYVAPSIAGEDTIRASYNGKVADSILTVTIEEAVVIDYYVGWTTGTKAQFAGKTDSEMVNGATGFSSVVNPNYTHAFGSNNIFYLMYQANKAPRKVTLTSQGVPMDQDLVNDNVCPHNDVTIDDIVYKVFGIRLITTEYDPTDTMTVLF